MKNSKILCFLVLLLTVSCQSELDKYYELPDWLKGSAYEVLEERGNYTLFLEAVDKSEFKDLVRGKGIITVMAPNDDAFRAYLTKIGQTSVSGILPDELNKLVGYHLVYYSFSKNTFMNYNPYGVDVEMEELVGEYYKFRTKSRDAITEVVDLASGGAIRKIMRKERFLPIFTKAFFQTRLEDPKAAYEQLYPGSTWAGDEGFNVSNASVSEYDVVTDNGYIHCINEVLEPLETVNGELQKPGSDYTTFAQLYDRFKAYTFDVDATRDYGKGDSLFVHSHIGLSPIASEWTTFEGLSAPDYAQMSYLTRTAYNILAPDNKSVDAFFNKYWSGYYDNILQVNYYPLYVLLRNHVWVGSFLTPTSFKNVVTVSRDLVDGHVSTELGLTKVCSNGVIYGFKDNILTPDIFESPAAPALRDPQYNMMMMMIYRSYLNYFNHDTEQYFDVFYPSDNMIVRNSTYNGSILEYLRGNSYLFESETINIESDDGMKAMTQSQAKGFAGAHIADRIVSSRVADDQEEIIYGTVNDYEYLYRVGDKIYSSAVWNNKETMVVPELKVIDTYKYGTAYQLLGEEAGAPALTPEASNFKDIILSPMKPADFAGYDVYLNMMTIDDSTPPFDFLQGERFIVFVPTREAIMKDVQTTKHFPMTGAQTLKDDFGKAMYVNVNSSSLQNYPFPGSMGKQETTLKTFYKVLNDKGERVETTITLIDTGSELIVRDRKGNEAKVISAFPYIYADGAAYMIDGVLDLLN